ncbi:hypothetical protein PIB30_017119 [Stylosanthes scabra]|uniref:Transmembrane protein n=1 Tax=Stylosanthes scabra TaxID=79078 RepID=A0ABU6U7W6_9FABA|nr:hypothetical protein [Stylosanthes scabra]
MGARPYSGGEKRSCYLLSLLGTPDRFGSLKSGRPSHRFGRLSGMTQGIGPMSSTTSCGPFHVTGRPPKVGLLFGLRSRVRTLSLRGVVAINGRTPLVDILELLPTLQSLTPLPLTIATLSNSLFPSLLLSPSALRHGAVALRSVLGLSSSCIVDVGSVFFFFVFIIVSRFISPFQMCRGRDSGFSTGLAFPEFNKVFVFCYIPCHVVFVLICVCWSSGMVPIALFPSSCPSSGLHE